MGDFTFVVPPAATTPTPAAVAAPEPAAAPRCRRVHFPDFPSSALVFPPSAADDDDAMAEEEAEPAEKKAASELEEDRMDLLWEDFNEELTAMRRADGGRARAAAESSESESDSESAGRAPTVGCFPVLRSSARAGGAGHYRRRAGTWVLLMKIFRRLFVIDKTISAAAARRHATGSAR